MKNINSFGEILKQRAETDPGFEIYHFLDTQSNKISSLSTSQLDNFACAISSQVSKSTIKGDRALLLFPHGLDFIKAFFACLYRGIIAVPLAAPSLNITEHDCQRILAVIKDAEIKIILTTQVIKKYLESHFKSNTIQWLTVDDIGQTSCSNQILETIKSNDIAFLQYTSGSTGEPKGVMVSHKNILHNSRIIQQEFGNEIGSRLVSWLPFHHDMGLIGTLLQPMYVGFEVLYLSPIAFLQRPITWLQAISNFRASLSGAPNFAYDLCIKQITETEKKSLDLSSWKTAFNGAEPVRSSTIERFAQEFSKSGFNKRAFTPCYGLAESTLLVSCAKKDKDSLIKAFDGESLSKNKVILASLDNNSTALHLVSNGVPSAEFNIQIVDKDTLTVCPQNQVGEIWVSSDSVADGYWKKSDISEKIFKATLPNMGNFLRTGDLGFIYDKSLFVAGRLKDIIIIAGINYYPQDIENVVEQAHSSIKNASTSAISFEENGLEKLIIISEVNRATFREWKKKKDIFTEEKISNNTDIEKMTSPEKVLCAIRNIVINVIGIDVHDVVFVKPGTMPKTTSGKIRRQQCKQQYLSKNLDVIYSLLSIEENIQHKPKSISEKLNILKSFKEIKEGLWSEAVSLLQTSFEHSKEDYIFNLIKCNEQTLFTYSQKINAMLKIPYATNVVCKSTSFDELANLLMNEQKQFQEMIYYIYESIISILKCREEDISIFDPINKFGITSLMATELVSKIEQDKDISVSIYEILEDINILQLAIVLIEKKDKLEQVSISKKRYLERVEI